MGEQKRLTTKDLERAVADLQSKDVSATLPNLTRYLNTTSDIIQTLWTESTKKSLYNKDDFYNFIDIFRQAYREKYRLTYRQGELSPKQKSQVGYILTFLSKEELDWKDYISWVFRKVANWHNPVGIGLIACHSFLHEFVLYRRERKNTTPAWVDKT